MKFNDKIIVFSTSSYGYLQEKVCQNESFDLGEIERKVFPDGEVYHRIKTNVQYKEVVLIGGTISEKETLELYDIACALVGYGVRKLNLILPYFGYSTMERAILKGEIVKAKTRARLLSSIPPASFGNRVFMIDLHADGIPFYFEGAIRPFHIEAKELIVKEAKRLGGDNFVMASTDAGRAKAVEALAMKLGVSAAFVYKRRESGSETNVTGINADVKDKDIVIYDDMIRTGGSLIKAAHAYKKAGANKIYVVSTHGIFPNKAMERIKNAEVIEKVVVTDSHPNVFESKNDLLEIVSIGDLLIQKINFYINGES